MQNQSFKFSTATLILLLISILLIGLVVGYTTSAFSSKASATGTLTFAVNGHKGTFNIENGEVSGYDTKNNLYTKFYITPDQNYTTDATCSILMGSNTLSTSAYTYSSGLLSIKNTDITDDLIINISCIGIQINVNLNADGGSNGQASVVVNYNSQMQQLTSLPTKDGYAFKGYYSDLNGQGTQYYDASGLGTQKCDFITTKTLYAYWIEVILYDLIFEYQQENFPDSCGIEITDPDGNVFEDTTSDSLLSRVYDDACEQGSTIKIIKYYDDDSYYADVLKIIINSNIEYSIGCIGQTAVNEIITMNGNQLELDTEYIISGDVTIYVMLSF